MIELVNHPEHYNSHPSGVECIDIIEHMTFCLGNVIKYIWRADCRMVPIQDLEKAAFYLKREIDRRKDEAQDKEERSRKSDINKRVESDWAFASGSYEFQTNNEEGSVSTSEHLLQHDAAWEDYIRTQGAPSIYSEAKSPEQGCAGLEC